MVTVTPSLFYAVTQLLLWFCLWMLLHFGNHMPPKAMQHAIPCTEVDRLAIDHALLSLHIYAQHFQGIPWRLDEGVVEQSMGRVFIHAKKNLADPSVAGWNFYPLFGRTGIASLARLHFEKESMLGFVAFHKEKNKITVVFRNSRRLTDWAHNLNRSFEKSDLIGYEGLFHKGYVLILKRCQKELDELLQKIVEAAANRDSLTILFAGHSLGGAMATLAAAYVVSHPAFSSIFSRKQVQLVTFAAPYVGLRTSTANFPNWLEERVGYVRCFERTTDIAPMLTRMAHVKVHRKGWKVGISLGKPVAPGTPQPLHHFEDSWLDFLKAHDIGKYRRGIYEEMDLPYTPLLWTIG